MSFDKRNALICFLTMISLAGLISVSGANDQLAQIVCRETDRPVVCLECLKSTPRADLTTKPGVATSVIDCLKGHGSALGADMIGIASSSGDDQAKTIFSGCGASYADSNRGFSAAIAMIKGQKYDDAEKTMAEVLYQHYTCLYNILEYKKVVLDEKIEYKMRVYEDLCEGVERIIEKL